MSDVVFVAAIFVLTAVAALFLVACNKVMGPDEQALAEGGSEELLEFPADRSGAGT